MSVRRKDASKSGLSAKREKPEKFVDSKGLYWLLLFYYFFEYVRLHESYLFFLGPTKIVGLTSYILLIVFIFGHKRYLKEVLSKRIIYFILLIAAMVPFSVNTFFALSIATTMSMTIFGTVFTTVLLLNTQEKFIKFLHFWVVLSFVLAMITIDNGGTGTGSFILDENDAACVLNMAVAYTFYMALNSKNSFSLRALYMFFAAVVSLAVVYTASRGGFLGFVAVVGLIIALSKNKVRNSMKVVAAAVVLSGALVAMLPAGYFDEMQTITNTEDETRNERLDSWENGWIMFKHNPIFGVGPDNYPWNVGYYEKMASHWKGPDSKSLSGRAAHSLFFTLVPELGAVGTIIYFLIIYEMIAICRRIIKDYEKSPEGKPEEYYLFAKAGIAATGTYMINSVFITTLYYPLLWHLMGFILAMKLTYPKIEDIGTEQKRGKSLRKANFRQNRLQRS